ncbi:MAG: hypothetical protein L3J82_05530 [Planctomycetes bacterium]|nr:hypothetical protein [Planctomycetota bacterium]
MRVTTMLSIALLTISVGVFSIGAQKNKPEAKPDTKAEPTEPEKAIELDEKELKAAEALRLQIGPQNAALVNSLRYLIRPEFETELMQGRRHRPCPLEPLEIAPTGLPTNLQLLRLLAILQTGTPATPTVDKHTRHFIDTVPEGSNLPRLGLEMQVVIAAHNHPGIAWDDELKIRARAIFDKAQKLRSVTTIKSPLIIKQVHSACWFACHLWRSVIYSGALRIGLEDLPSKIWIEDLHLLSRTFVSKRGWVATKKRADKDHPEISKELNCCLLAMATFQLASSTSEGFLSGKTLGKINKALKRAPEILTILLKDFDEQGFTAGRLFLSQSLGDLAPERTSAEPWREGIREFSCALVDPTGEIPPTSNLARELGLAEEDWRRGHASAAETALFLLGMSGGLLPKTDPPLIKEDISKLGQAMYSLALLHAKQAPPHGEDLQADINYAIKTGVEYLASIQNEDGTWPGQYNSYPGNTAISLLAMLHGDWKRDSLQIKSGLKAIEKQTTKDYIQTYDAALILMLFQKYYETEQRKAGVLSASNKKEFNKARTKVFKKLEPDHRKLIERLVNLLKSATTSGGGYGYYRLKGSEKGPFGAGHSDNSCSQYVMLGFKSASLLGCDVGHGIFALEAARLISQYAPQTQFERVEYEQPEDGTGKTDTRAKKAKILPGGWGYKTVKSTRASIQMTAAGLSSLAICRDELELRGKLNKSLRFNIGLHMRGAVAFIGHSFHKPIDFETHSILTAGVRDGWGEYYNLYSVERGCVMAGEKILDGDVDWYKIGAQALINAQKWDGGWGRVSKVKTAKPQKPHTINTCMAILFLKKASLPVLTGPTRKPDRTGEPGEKGKPEEDGPTTGK